MSVDKKVRSERTKIIHFEDYRDFICARWRDLQGDRKISLEQASRRLKTRKSYLSMVMAKKRHISAEKVAALSELLKMSDFEKEYFYFLFLFATTKEVQIKRYLSSTLARYRFNETFKQDAEASIQSEKEKIFAQWPKQLLFNLVRLSDFTWNPEWIEKRVVSSQDRKSLTEALMSELVEMGAIRKSGTGYKSIAHINKSARPPEQSIARQIMDASLERARIYNSSKESHPHGPSAAIVMPLSKGRADEANALLIDLQKALIRLSVEDPEPQEVYFFVCHMLGLTRDHA